MPFSERLALLFEATADNAEAMGPQTRELISAMLALSIPQTADSDDHRIRLAFRKFLEAGLATGEVRRDEDLDTLVEVVIGVWYSIFLGSVRIEATPFASAPPLCRDFSRAHSASARRPRPDQESSLS